MLIGSNDIFGLCGDRAVNKLVVVRVGCDDAKSEAGFKKKNVGVKIKQQRQKPLHLPPARCAGQSCDGFLVFEQNLVGDRQLDSPSEKGIPDGTPDLVPAKELHQHVRVDTNPHHR